MNVKKVLAITIAALIVCLAFVGSASAFTVTQEAKSTPTTLATVPGENIVTTFQIKLVSDEMKLESYLDFGSDLESSSIYADLYRSDGSSYITSMTPSATNYQISGYDLSGYGSDLVLSVKCSGYVSSASAGKSICPVSVSVVNPKVVSGVNSYSAPSKMVYDVNTLASSLQTLNNGITSLDALIAECVAAGYDCTEAKNHLETARSKYKAAVAAGTADGVTAFSNYEDGLAALEKAKKSLAYVSLSLIKTKIAEIDGMVAQLYSKGWNSEAKTVDVKNRELTSTYETCEKAYLAGNPDMVAIANLRVDTVNLYNEASTYLEESQNVLGGIMDILPFILIGVGVIVVGVIVFFVIRRRKPSWDELG